MLDVTVRPMREDDLGVADHVMRVAFGTFLGMPDPTTFMGDANYVGTRWRADPEAAWVATADDNVVGSNFVSTWGSFGFFGPLTVRPDLWNQRVAQRLLEPVIDTFEARGVTHAGLYTFSHSQKHVALYQKFGFWPRHLIAMLSCAIPDAPPTADHGSLADSLTLFSGQPVAAQEDTLREARALTNTIYDGLDVSSEIRSVFAQHLGDTVLVRDEGGLVAFAVCHVGAGTEAGSGACYVKFAAAKPGSRAAPEFARLVRACEDFAARRGVARLVVGMNTAREFAYRHLLAHGFRIDRLGVAMERPSDGGYNRRDVHVIDDWR
ncbi:MAG TPA: GNAT family N-acetyltransferase [Gemmatimonadaceae bacterium]